MDFANRLRQRRKFLKLTQVQLAEAAGMTQQMIQQLETRKVLTTGKIVVLAGALGVRPEWLENGIEPMVDSVTAHDQVFLAAYHKLPKPEQDAVRTLVFRNSALPSPRDANHVHDSQAVCEHEKA